MMSLTRDVPLRRGEWRCAQLQPFVVSHQRLARTLANSCRLMAQGSIQVCGVAGDTAPGEVRCVCCRDILREVRRAVGAARIRTARRRRAVPGALRDVPEACAGGATRERGLAQAGATDRDYDEQSADGLRRPTLRGDGGGFPDGGLVGGGDIFFGTAEALDTSG